MQNFVELLIEKMEQRKNEFDEFNEQLNREGEEDEDERKRLVEKIERFIARNLGKQIWYSSLSIQQQNLLKYIFVQVCLQEEYKENLTDRLERINF